MFAHFKHFTISKNFFKSISTNHYLQNNVPKKFIELINVEIFQLNYHTLPRPIQGQVQNYEKLKDAAYLNYCTKILVK